MTAIISLSTVAAALLGVVALILLAARLARSRIFGLRTSPVHAVPHLKVTDTLALDPRRRLRLLDCDGQAVLLLTGGATDIMLPLGRAE